MNIALRDAHTSVWKQVLDNYKTCVMSEFAQKEATGYGWAWDYENPKLVHQDSLESLAGKFENSSWSLGDVWSSLEYIVSSETELVPTNAQN